MLDVRVQNKSLVITAKLDSGQDKTSLIAVSVITGVEWFPAKKMKDSGLNKDIMERVILSEAGSSCSTFHVSDGDGEASVHRIIAAMSEVAS